MLPTSLKDDSVAKVMFDFGVDNRLRADDDYLFSESNKQVYKGEWYMYLFMTRFIIIALICFDRYRVILYTGFACLLGICYR